MKKNTVCFFNDEIGITLKSLAIKEVFTNERSRYNEKTHKRFNFCVKDCVKRNFMLFKDN